MSSLVSSQLIAKGIDDTHILSSDQKKSLQLNEEKIINDSEKLHNDWINPITYTYSNQDNESTGKTKTSTIAISQPIFRSGGIYNAIKYANNLKTSSILSLELQKKALIQQALNLAYNIKKTDLQITQQKLAINNAKIDLKIKKESVLNGLLDTSFLNNALITLNSQKAKLLDLEYAKGAYLNNFNTLSKKDIHEITLPKLQQISMDSYKSNNIEIKKTANDVKVQNNLRYINQAQYLPSVNVNYSKTYYHNDVSTSLQKGDTNDIMGFSIVVPLDITSFDDIASSKANYLKAKNDFKILQQKETNFFKSQELKIATLDKKINLTKENINAYNELLSQMEELSNAGIKTSDDVLLLSNSKRIEELNIKILEFEKQIELLEIYGKITSDKI